MYVQLESSLSSYLSRFCVSYCIGLLYRLLTIERYFNDRSLRATQLY